MNSKKNLFLLNSSKFVTDNRKMLKYIYTTQLTILFLDRKAYSYNINKRDVKCKR